MNLEYNVQTYETNKIIDKFGNQKAFIEFLEKNILNNEILDIISNPENMRKMGEKASTKSVENVQEKIYNEIKKLVKGDK